MQNGILYLDIPVRGGGVSELADEHDLGSCAVRRGGSNPPFPSFPRNWLCSHKALTSYLSCDEESFLSVL